VGFDEVRTDVNDRMAGKHRNATKRLVLRLHLVPCSNDDAAGMTDTQVIDTFWNEFKEFNQKSGAFWVC